METQQRYYKRFVTIVMCLITTVIVAQTHIDVYAQEEGATLLTKVQNGFKPKKSLNYDQARDEMFGKIWNIQDSVRGIYSGYAIKMKSGVDPSSHAFSLDINTEHVYPQSKGANYGNAKADLHHLMPCKTNVNTDRSSFPFAEVNDVRAKRWYYKARNQSSKPTSNIDEYSEWSGTTFEPRESKKGDIARAMFYFWTIYRTQASNADADFFSNQQETLCNWIASDAVDLEEFERNLKIENFQGNANPFILDCTLAKRLGYCSEVTAMCNALVSTDEVSYEGDKAVVFPNPASQSLFIQSNETTSWNLYDAYGRLVLEDIVSGQEVSIIDLAEGFYVLTNNKQTERFKILVKR